MVQLDGEEEGKMKEERSGAEEFTNGIDLKWCNFVKLLIYKEGKKILTYEEGQKL